MDAKRKRNLDFMELIEGRLFLMPYLSPGSLAGAIMATAFNWYEREWLGDEEPAVDPRRR
jgi:hypothetical protein